MTRKTSHFQGKEPILESLLRDLRYAKIVKHIPLNKNVLDLGCGYNYFLLQKIVGNLNSATGVDINLPQKSSRKKIKLVSADINKKIPLKTNSYDVATAMAILEHVENPEFFLKEIKRVLKKNGKVIITTPSLNAKPFLEFLSFKLGIISKDEIADHKQYFTKYTLYKVLKKVGYHKIEVKQFQLGFNLFAIAYK